MTPTVRYLIGVICVSFTITALVLLGLDVIQQRHFSFHSGTYDASVSGLTRLQAPKEPGAPAVLISHEGKSDRLDLMHNTERRGRIVSDAHDFSDAAYLRGIGTRVTIQVGEKAKASEWYSHELTWLLDPDPINPEPSTFIARADWPGWFVLIDLKLKEDGHVAVIAPAPKPKVEPASLPEN